MPVYAYPYPTFQPSMRIITAITNANPAQVTTSFANQYLTGTIVRLDIPYNFGMQQANGLFGTILTIVDPQNFTVGIDTSLFSPFVVPMNPSQQAQVVPIGEVNDQLTAAVQNALPY